MELELIQSEPGRSQTRQRVSEMGFPVEWKLELVRRWALSVSSPVVA